MFAFLKKTDKLFEIWLFSTFIEVACLNVVFDFQKSEILFGRYLWRKIKLGGFVINLVSNAHDFYENCNSKMSEISIKDISTEEESLLDINLSSVYGKLSVWLSKFHWLLYKFLLASDFYWKRWRRYHKNGFRWYYLFFNFFEFCFCA